MNSNDLVFRIINSTKDEFGNTVPIIGVCNKDNGKPYKSAYDSHILYERIVPVITYAEKEENVLLRAQLYCDFMNMILALEPELLWTDDEYEFAQLITAFMSRYYLRQFDSLTLNQYQEKKNTMQYLEAVVLIHAMWSNDYFRPRSARDYFCVSDYKMDENFVLFNFYDDNCDDLITCD